MNNNADAFFPLEKAMSVFTFSMPGLGGLQTSGEGNIDIANDVVVGIHFVAFKAVEWASELEPLWWS